MNCPQFSYSLFILYNLFLLFIPMPSSPFARLWQIPLNDAALLPIVSCWVRGWTQWEGECVHWSLISCIYQASWCNTLASMVSGLPDNVSGTFFFFKSRRRIKVLTHLILLYRRSGNPGSKSYLLDMRLSAVAVFLQSWSPKHVQLLFYHRSMFFDCLFFISRVLVVRRIEKQFCTILPVFEVLCTILFICKRGIITEHIVWSDRNSATSGTFSYC